MAMYIFAALLEASQLGEQHGLVSLRQQLASTLAQSARAADACGRRDTERILQWGRVGRSPGGFLLRPARLYAWRRRDMHAELRIRPVPYRPPEEAADVTCWSLHWRVRVLA